MRRLNAILVVFFTLVIFMLGCARQQAPISVEPVIPGQSSEPEKNLTPKPECTSDRECLPASCCHPNTCVPIGKEPRCYEAVCTDVCQPNTLDCGQGKCECVNSRCLAVIYG